MKKNNQPKKHLGQNFLINKDISKNIITELKIDNNSNVLEIGPGLGSLTKYIEVNQVKKIILIEKDSDLIQNLKENYPKAIILNIDALDLNLSDISKIHINNEKCKIVGNLPYNVGTLILMNTMKELNLIDLMIFMLQKEVIDKIFAKSGKKYGITSVVIQKLCNIEYIFKSISPNNFNPIPKVDSAVIKITPKNEKIEKKIIENFIKFTKLIFNQRRKKLSTLIKNLDCLNVEFIKEFLEKRPEQLKPEEIFSISNYFKL